MRTLVMVNSQRFPIPLLTNNPNYIMEINNETQRLQNQAVELLDLIEDTSEHFCDEHFVSGEQFYVMMSALCDAKLRQFPYDLEEEVDELDDDEDWTNNIEFINEEEDDQMTVTNNKERKSFDELYEEYSSMSIPEQLNNLKQLGRQLVTTIDKIIDQLDDIEEEENKDV